MQDPHVQVALPDYVREIAKEAARTVIEEHVKSCPFTVDDCGKRLRTLEVKFATAVGLMIGSGAIGGGLSVGLMKLLGG
jgi:hypothetical protein